MSFFTTKEHYGKVYRAVLMLILIGPLAIIASNALVASVFSDTSEKRTQIATIKTSITRLSLALTNFADEAENYFEESEKSPELMKPTQTTWAERFALYLEHLKHSTKNHHLDLTNLIKIVDSCTTLVAENETWRSQFIPVARDVATSQTLDQARKLNSSILEATEIQIGKTRLKDAVAKNSADGSSRTELTSKSAELLGLLLAFKLEMMEIGQAVESVASTANLDDLREITTNRLSPIIERSLQLLSGIARIDLASADSLRYKVTLLYEKLFGADFSYNKVQMELVQGKDGLLTLYTNYLAQRKMHELLLEKATEHLHFLRQEIARIQQRAEHSATEAVVEIQWRLRNSLRLMLGLSVVALAIYLALSVVSLKALRKQVLADSTKEIQMRVTNQQLRKNNQSLREAITVASEMERNASIATSLQAEFFADLNRDIRTPLSGMVGMLRVLLSEHYAQQLPSEALKCLQALEQSASSIVRLLNDLVDCALLDAHKLNVELVDFDLAEILNPVISSLTSPGQNFQPSLLMILRDDVPRLIVGDPSRIGQIVHSIVWQILQFNSQIGSIVVRVAKASESPKNVTLQFSIVDPSGLITPQQLELIDRGFVRTETSVVKTHGSNGLSLVTAGRLISFLGGHAWIENSQEKGFTVHFTLRVQKQRTTRDSAAQCTADGESETQTQSALDSYSSLPALSATTETTPKKILLVEDDLLYQTLAIQLLTQLGYETFSATNGKIALPILAQENIDMLLLDIFTPEMDGLSTARAIRSSEIGTDIHLPIIGFTSSASKSEREECLACGMDDYVTKPASLLAMQGVIERNLRTRSRVSRKQIQR